MNLEKMRQFLVMICFLFSTAAFALPPGFVYLHDVDPSILQDIRYASSYNFIGRPIHGYHAPVCILTKPAAQALSKVQSFLRLQGLSLKVFDCYRPTLAVADFMAWSQDAAQQQMKAIFYPRINKADVFALGYIAARSGHSRGSTVDLTIVSLSDPLLNQRAVNTGLTRSACNAPYAKRYRETNLDMGTGFDCLDVTAHLYPNKVSQVAYQHRLLLLNAMLTHGFVSYPKEWWHFTLKNEPYPETYFNFPVA